MEAPRRLSLLAQQQYGLVSLRQAVALGLPARTLQGRVRRQGWVRVHRGVYALPGSVRSYERDVAGALLAAGPSAVACAGAAAFLHGLTRAQIRPIELAVPVPRRARALSGVVVHRSGTLWTVDIVQRGGLRATAIPRTLCDLAPIAPRELREFPARALQQGATTIPRIAACSARLGSHPGIATLREVLAQLSGTSSDSGWERDVREWLRREGLAPDPRVFPVRAEDDVVCELDIAYPDEMVYVDCHGFPWHSLPSSLETDSVRANGIVAAGWLGLTLTQEQFDQRSVRFLRQLRTLLAQREGFARQHASLSRSQARSVALPARLVTPASALRHPRSAQGPRTVAPIEHRAVAPSARSTNRADCCAGCARQRAHDARARPRAGGPRRADRGGRTGACGPRWGGPGLRTAVGGPGHADRAGAGAVGAGAGWRCTGVLACGGTNGRSEGWCGSSGWILGCRAVGWGWWKGLRSGLGPCGLG